MTRAKHDEKTEFRNRNAQYRQEEALVIPEGREGLRCCSVRAPRVGTGDHAVGTGGAVRGWPSSLIHGIREGAARRAKEDGQEAQIFPHSQ